VLATAEITAGSVPSVAFISYLNTMDDTETRQLQQKAIWYFSCLCSLCGNQRIDREKHSLECGGCGRARPLHTKRWHLFGPCQYCGREEGEAECLARYREVYTSLTEQPADPELAEQSIGEMEGVFSERDILYLQTLHYVHTACTQAGRWQAALSYGERVLPAFRLYYGHSTGVVAGLLVRLAQASAELGQQEQAEEMFRAADRIYRVVPGVEHPFYKEDFNPLAQQYVANLSC